MEKGEFLKYQYLALREEIKETKRRIFQTMGFGLIVVPASHFLSQAYKIDTVTLTLPILVVVVALIYLAENNSLMRCGRYIKHYIEPEINDVLGWEEWLETKSCYDTRDVDKYLSYAFYLLFFVYFAGSVFFAFCFAFLKYGVMPTALLLGVYVAIGIWFIIFLLRNIRISTTTEYDCQNIP